MSYTEQYLNLVIIQSQKNQDDEKTMSFEMVAEKIGYAFPKLGSRTSSEVQDYIDQQIKNLLTTTAQDYIEVDSLYAIVNQLEIKRILSKGKDCAGYDDIQILVGLLKGIKLAPLSNVIVWEKVLTLLYYRKKICFSSSEFWPSSRNLRIVDCISFFKNRGWGYACVDGSLELTNEMDLLNLIDDAILDIGLKNILNWIFSELTYNSATSMFIIKRICNHEPSNESQIPYGFILNRVLYLASTENIFKNKTFVSKKIEYFKKIVLCFTSYLDILPHNIYETMMPVSLNLDAFGRWVAYDWLVDFLQYPYQEIDEFIRFLSKNKELNEFAKKFLGYSLLDYFDAIQDIQFAANEKEITIVNPQKLSQDCCCELLVKIMDDNASNINNVNEKFKTYKDITSIDYYFNPFIKIDADQYLLLPKSLMSIGFYESIATKYRNAGFCAANGSDFDSFVGTLIEHFVEEKCLQFGGKIGNGQIEIYVNEKYKISHEDQVLLDTKSSSGECDLIIATEKNICFVESKKKNLCRKSYNGHTVNAYVDLSKSFFPSQKQALKHEMLLKKNGKILFDSSRDLCLNERNVVRISLTTFDFKSLQSKIIAQNLLINSFNKMFVSQNGDFINELSKINEVFVEITHLVEKGKEYELIDEKFFHNICWLNVFQLVFVLKKCKNSNAFDNLISSLLHISYGYYNVWNELFVTCSNKSPLFGML